MLALTVPSIVRNHASQRGYLKGQRTGDVAWHSTALVVDVKSIHTSDSRSCVRPELSASTDGPRVGYPLPSSSNTFLPFFGRYAVCISIEIVPIAIHQALVTPIRPGDQVRLRFADVC